MRTLIMSNVIDLQIVKLEAKLETLMQDRERRIDAINSLTRIIKDFKATPPFSFHPTITEGKKLIDDQLFVHEKTLENHENLLQMEQKTIYNLRNEIMFLQFEKHAHKVIEPQAIDDHYMSIKEEE